MTNDKKALMDMPLSLTIGYIYNYCANAKSITREKQSILSTSCAHDVSHSGITAVDEYSSEQIDIDEAYLKQAIWTKEGFLSEKDIRSACENMLNKSKKRNTKSSEGDGDDVAKRNFRKYRTLEEEIKLELVKDIWRRETEWLSFSRNDARIFLTKSIGFLFVSVSREQWKFVAPREYYGKLEKLQLTKAYKGDEISQLQVVNRENGLRWENLLEMFLKLRFRCSYEVLVTKEERRRGRNQDNIVRIERKICILETAIRFVTYYQQCDCHEELMRLAPETLKVTYLVAMSFAGYLKKCRSL